jgi:ribosomal protein L37E
MNEALASDLLKKSSTHPVVLDEILTTLWPGWVEQEPETTLAMVRSFTNQGAVDPAIRTKINALKVIHSSESPWDDWEVCQWVGQALNDQIADFSNAYRPELGELFITVETLNKLRKLVFMDEVKRWMAACCLDLGIIYVPQPLDFLQPLLAQEEYRCTKCGNIDLDEDNNKCDTCGAPQSALVLTPRYIDWRDIQRAWELSQNEDISELRLGETVKGVHVAKLAAARILSASRREQMNEELRYVRGR